MKREVRSKVQIRATEIGGKPGVTLHVIRPNVVDDYGSVWNPHAFDESLSKRLPTLTWSHNWEEPLGPAVGFRTSPDGPEVDFVFSDFADVPMARRAHSQIADGTIQDCSVGFSDAVRRKPTDDELRSMPGMVEYMESAGLDEVALVLRGAVPGAKVVALRAGKVDLDAFIEIAKRKVAGDLTEDEARAAVELLGGPDDDDEGDPPPPVGDPPPDPVAELAAVEAEGDAAMELIGRSPRDRQMRFVDRMADDVRQMLDGALTSRLHPGPGQWCYVRDFSDVEVVFYREGFGNDGAFALAYSLDGNKVTLGDTEVAVTTKTSYVPR